MKEYKFIIYVKAKDETDAYDKINDYDGVDLKENLELDIYK